MRFELALKEWNLLERTEQGKDGSLRTVKVFEEPFLQQAFTEFCTRLCRIAKMNVVCDAFGEHRVSQMVSPRYKPRRELQQKSLGS